MSEPSSYSSDQLEAVQAVVDRVSSYQESAPEGTVVEQLREGLGGSGVDLPEEHVILLADAIEAHDHTESSAVSAADVLG